MKTIKEYIWYCPACDRLITGDDYDKSLSEKKAGLLCYNGVYQLLASCLDDPTSFEQYNTGHYFHYIGEL